MKNLAMKTLISLTITSLLLTTSPVHTYSYAETEPTSQSLSVLAFSDMTSHWSNTYVTALTEGGIISGYGDGTFRPDNTLKRIEFIVLTLKALENEGTITLDASTESGEYWGMPYVKKAIFLGLITDYSEDTSTYEALITREEMASIIVKAYEKLGGDTEISEGVENKAKGQIGDLVNVSTDLKAEVTTAYALNFIVGYGDNTFKPMGNATRGEASVVISKLLDETLRTPIEADEVVIDDSEMANTEETANTSKTIDEDYTVWKDKVANLSEEYKEKYLVAEYVGTGYNASGHDELINSYYNANGELVIVDSGEYGYGNVTVTDDFTPDLNERLGRLINYMVGAEHVVNLYYTNVPEKGVGGQNIFATFSGVKYSIYNNFAFRIYNNYYLDPLTYNYSETEKGATLMLSLNRMYDGDTDFDEFKELAYDPRYMAWLQESLVAFFGEAYGSDIAEWVKNTHYEYAHATRNFYEHYDEVTTIGNVDMVVPSISSDRPSTTILFTIH